MPANTPIFGFPYPLGTDPVAQGDNVIQELAEDVEAVINTGMGLRKITPTVSGTGTSIASNGDVILTAATSAVISNAFPSTFNNFRVVFSDFSGTIAQDLLFQLRDATTTVTTNYRSGGVFYGYTGTSGAVASVTNRIGVGTAGVGKLSASVDVYNPNLAVITGFISHISNIDAFVIFAGQNTNTVAYSNCQVSVASGNATGRISFYGYR